MPQAPPYKLPANSPWALQQRVALAVTGFGVAAALLVGAPAPVGASEIASAAAEREILVEQQKRMLGESCMQLCVVGYLMGGWVGG